MELLRNNHNLKDLALTGPFFELPSEIKFRLEKLAIYRFLDGSIDQGALFTLLETQSQSLESLEICERFDRACLELILGMPKLSSFTTVYERVRDAISHPAQPLPVNTTITSLEFKFTTMELRSQEVFETFIRSLRSLKKIKCEEINQEEFNFLARDVPALESFDTDVLNISHFPEGDIFPNIKEFKVWRIKSRADMPEPNGDNNFAVLARKAMRESKKHFGIDSKTLKSNKGNPLQRKEKWFLACRFSRKTL